MTRRFFESDDSYQNYLIQEKISALVLIDTQLNRDDYSEAARKLEDDLIENHGFEMTPAGLSFEIK